MEKSRKAAMFRNIWWKIVDPIQYPRLATGVASRYLLVSGKLLSSRMWKARWAAPAEMSVSPAHPCHFHVIWILFSMNY